MFSTSRLDNARIGGGSARRIACGLAVACAAIFASGCSLFSSELDKAAAGAGKAVHLYCENVTVPEIREQIREAVNTHAAPHSVSVTCVDEVTGETVTVPE